MGKIPHIIWMFIGVLVYELSGIFSMVVDYALYFRMLGLGIAFFAFFTAPKNRVPVAIANTANVLLVIVAFILLRGSLMGRVPYMDGYYNSIYDIVRNFLVYPHSGAAILLPFAFLVDIDYSEFKYFRKIAIISALVSLALCIFFWDLIMTSDRGLIDLVQGDDSTSIRNLSNDIFIGFGMVLCMTWSMLYSKKLNAIILLATLVVFFLISVLGGGRGGSVTAFCYILIFLYFYYKYQRSNGGFILRRFWSIALIFAFAYGLVYLYQNTTLFDFLIYRSFEGHDVNSGLRSSSREGFMQFMVNDFNNHPLSWIFGRGVNGTFDIGGGARRHTLEWGFMWLILKGGILYLLFYVVVLYKTFKKGFFHSNNVLSKSLAVLCLAQVLLLIPFGVPAVTVQFLLVWHSVRLLNTPEFVSLTDEEVNNLINS